MPQLDTEPKPSAGAGWPTRAAMTSQVDAEALRQAFALLPPRCQRLLGLLVVNDPPSYKEISARLSMPIGSIGPTRGRCLEHLRRILADLSAGN